MTKRIPILSYTHQSFIDEMQSCLGKGHIPAGLIYEEFFRTGIVLSQRDAFRALAQALVDRLC